MVQLFRSNTSSYHWCVYKSSYVSCVCISSYHWYIYPPYHWFVPWHMNCLRHCSAIAPHVPGPPANCFWRDCRWSASPHSTTPTERSPSWCPRVRPLARVVLVISAVLPIPGHISHLAFPHKKSCAICKCRCLCAAPPRGMCMFLLWCGARVLKNYIVIVTKTANR